MPDESFFPPPGSTTAPQQPQQTIPQPSPYAPPQQQWPAQNFVPLQAPAPSGNGMAVAGFVVALVSLLVALIPLLNVVSIVGGLVAVVLSLVALRRARRHLAGGQGFAVAGLVLAVVALVAAVVVNALLAATFVAFDDAIEGAAAEVEDSASDHGTVVSEAEAAQAADAATVALGQSAQVGKYTVTVTAVDLDANAEIAAVGEHNPPATNHYVLADVSVTYTGSGEADAWMDLTHVLSGSDSRHYDATSCEAFAPADLFDAPTLTEGGSADYQVCFDVPLTALDGATLFVEESFSAEDTRAYWAVP